MKRQINIRLSLQEWREREMLQEAQEAQRLARLYTEDSNGRAAIENFLAFLCEKA